ncbi:DUF4125 family protein [Neisseria sp. Ec49-e6-T10]|uniref:DUF4125 family protein n=1 Tax=Neisseria sp. Ec49-e6-T10 TaxID=3140744 RepID=UPI003EBE051B
MHKNPVLLGRNACGCGYNVGSMMPEKPVLLENIIKIEWSMFVNVKDAGGISHCQQDPQTFCLMRVTQASIWEDDTLASYLTDLQNACMLGINLMTEKYARMMQSTHPLEYEQIKHELPPLNAQSITTVNQIIEHFEKWDDEIVKRYPKLRHLGRKQQDYSGNTSTVTYLKGELLTYSAVTLALCLRDVQNAHRHQINLAEKILESTAKFYGYTSLENLEHQL